MSRSSRARRRTAVSVVPAIGPTTALDRAARLVRAELARRGTDLGPLIELAPTLGVTVRTLHAAVLVDPHLGMCGTPDEPLVWSLPFGPLAAGFEPDYGDRRLRLVLPGPPPTGRSLIVSDSQLGADPAWTGNPAGRLGQTIERIYLMADRWLLAGPGAQARTERCGRLFELIAATWRASPTPEWTGGGLHIHRADHGRPIATRFWADGSPTGALELAVWVDDDGGRQLVNVYPGGTHRTMIREEA